MRLAEFNQKTVLTLGHPRGLLISNLAPVFLIVVLWPLVATTGHYL